MLGIYDRIIKILPYREDKKIVMNASMLATYGAVELSMKI